MAIKERKKYYISIRLFPSIILSLTCLAYSFAYLDNHYSSTFNYLQAAGYFGFSAIFLLLDVAMEVFYKSKTKTYGIFSIAIATGEGVYFLFNIITYFKELGEGDNPDKRMIPLVLLIVLLVINIIYRILSFLGIWKTDDNKGNDLFASYIGFLGLGAALLNSFPFANILIRNEGIKYSYVGILVDIALAVTILEALIGLLWLSWKKLRNSSKSNIFFYLTLLSLLSSIACIVVTAFAKEYDLIGVTISTWNYSFFSVSTGFLLAGSIYLNLLLKK